MISLIFIPGIPFIVVIYCIVFFLYLSMVAGDLQNPDRSLFIFLTAKYPCYMKMKFSPQWKLSGSMNTLNNDISDT